MSETIKVVAYARVSSKEQAQKDLSIPYQLEQIRNFCKQKGFKLITEYVDEGKSAKTDDRPAFQKMIGMAKSKIKGFEAIIIHKIDRFSRNNEDHVIYKALLREHGVKVISVSEPYDDDTPHGFLSNGILQLISQFYNMNLANEVRKGLVENAKRGYHNGGIPPYGYTIGKVRDANGNEKSIWVPDTEEKVKIVKRIFDMYVYQNMGFKRIVNTLNAEGVPSPNNKLWSTSTVISLLHNDAYIGVRTWNKRDEQTPGKRDKPKSEWVVVANAHQPLVTRDLFSMVRQKGQERNPTGNCNWTPSGPSPFILRGMLKCHKCGANMISSRNSMKGRGYTMSYICGTYNRKGKDACQRNPVSKVKIEKAVIDTLIREFSMLCYPDNLEYEVKKYQEERNREAVYKLSILKADICHIKRKTELATNENISGNPGQYFSQYIYELKVELEKLQEQEVELEKLVGECVVNREEMESVRGALRDFSNRIRIEPPDVQWELLKRYVKGIVLDEFTQRWAITVWIRRLDEDKEIMMEKKYYIQV